MVSKFIHEYSRNPVFNTLLLVPILLISALLMISGIIDYSLKAGMNNMEKRLGADLMLVPKGAKEDATDLMMTGARKSFYFNKSVYSDIYGIEGVSEITPQFFLKTLSADCCSSEVELVFFDPETDFFIKPWISEGLGGEVEAGSVVVGFMIDIEDDNTIKLFGDDYKVAGKMAKTGTSLDKSVYITFDMLETVVASAEEKGSIITDQQKSAECISSVYINLEEGYKLEDVLKEIHVRVTEDFDVVYPKQMSQDISVNLESIYSVIHILMIVIAFIFVVVLLIVNFLFVNEKKREVAILRVFGMTKGRAFYFFNKNMILITLIGTVIGSFVGALFVLPFGDYIGFQLQMSYLSPDFVSLFIRGIIIVLLMVVLSILAAIVPTLYLCGLEPYVALRREGE